jgi:hypothetical protein
VGTRIAGTNDEVEAASDDARVVLGVRASDMLDFGGMGLNCKPVMSTVRNERWMTKQNTPCLGATRLGPSRKMAARPVQYSKGSRVARDMGAITFVT